MKSAFLLISSSTFRVADWIGTCWCLPLTESFMWSSVSLGMRGYFCYTVSEYTPITHNTVQRPKCGYMCLFWSVSVRVCIVGVYGDYILLDECYLYFCAGVRRLVCIFIEVGTRGFYRTLETRLPCQWSPQTFPSSWGTEGFSVRLWECRKICDPIIPLTHSNQELPRSCSAFTAAPSGTTLILTRPNTLSGIKACFI